MSGADALREVWMEGYHRGLQERSQAVLKRVERAEEELALLRLKHAAAVACLRRILSTVRGSNLGYEIEGLLGPLTEGAREG